MQSATLSLSVLPPSHSDIVLKRLKCHRSSFVSAFQFSFTLPSAFRLRSLSSLAADVDWKNTSRRCVREFCRLLLLVESCSGKVAIVAL